MRNIRWSLSLEGLKQRLGTYYQGLHKGDASIN